MLDNKCHTIVISIISVSKCVLALRSKCYVIPNLDGVTNTAELYTTNVSYKMDTRVKYNIP